MTLATALTDRYDEQTLAELTNPRDPSATADVDAQITRAVTAVEDAFFPMYVQVTYDDTLAVDGQKHTEVAVMGVIALLRLWANPKSGSADEAWKAWIEIAQQGAHTFGGRKRVLPVTTSTSVHSTQDSARPEFDDDQFKDHTVNPPEDGDYD